METAKKQGKRRERGNRGLIYMAGMVILSLGIVLNTKTGLGVSPVIAVPFNVAVIWDWNLGDIVFLFYVFCVVMEFVLLGKEFHAYDLLQIPMSLVTSRFINLFDWAIGFNPQHWGSRFLLLAAAIFATGTGSAMMVMMKLIPNPADALAKVMGDKLHRGFGFGKNILDGSCFLTALILGLAFKGTILGMGAGTVLAVIFIGRSIAVFNHFFKYRLQHLAGIREAEENIQAAVRSA